MRGAFVQPVISMVSAFYLTAARATRRYIEAESRRIAMDESTADELVHRFRKSQISRDITGFLP